MEWCGKCQDWHLPAHDQAAELDRLRAKLARYETALHAVLDYAGYDNPAYRDVVRAALDGDAEAREKD